MKTSLSRTLCRITIASSKRLLIWLSIPLLFLGCEQKEEKEPEKRTNYKHLNFCGKDLVGEDFSGIDLTCSNFKNANLCKVNFSNAVLVGVDFQGAKLCEANLQQANLKDANLRGANLSDADLREAFLKGTSFIQTKVKDADITGAKGLHDFTRRNLLKKGAIDRSCL